jgi:copper chaperone CopZ
MTTTTYSVDGLTCGHCVGAVTAELSALDGVESVEVDLAPRGTSTVVVASAQPLSDEQVLAALDEAGDYRLVARA